jgi:hypothetical protein
MRQVGHARYGSEYHLLRYLGRHREQFNRKILELIGRGIGIEWLDFPFAIDGSGGDAEWKGLDFLPKDKALQNEWAAFWPQGKGIQNWDAVGEMTGCPDKEWLLVEAKAHIEEIYSDCKAIERGGRSKIQGSFDNVKTAMGVPAERDWLNGYYQYCNRLAVLYFLAQHNVKAHLLFVYFTGDQFPNKFICPETAAQWKEALQNQDEHVGVPPNNALYGRIHKLFLAVGE